MVIKIPKVEDYNVILNKAFRKARRAAGNVTARDPIMKKRIKELSRIETATNVVVSYLTKIHTEVPRVNMLPPFYRELISLIIDKNQFKKSMAAIRWAYEFVEKLLVDYKKKVKGARPQDLMRMRTQFYGRLSSVLKQVKKDLKFIDTCRIELKSLPDIKDMPTVVISGMPNVGKSSVLRSITGANPDIQKYPFTTRSILVGNIDRTVQVVDTPGLLDRQMDKRNAIEMKSVLALRYLAKKIIFVFDISGSSGYNIDEQLALYNEIKSLFKLPMIVCINKVDITDKSDVKKLIRRLKNLEDPIFRISAKEDEGINSLRDNILSGVMEGKEKFYKD